MVMEPLAMVEATVEASNPPRPSPGLLLRRRPFWVAAWPLVEGAAVVGFREDSRSRCHLPTTTRAWEERCRDLISLPYPRTTLPIIPQLLSSRRAP